MWTSSRSSGNLTIEHPCSAATVPSEIDTSRIKIKILQHYGMEHLGERLAMLKMHHIHLRSLDVDSTSEWYVRILGATITGRIQGLGGAETVRLDLGGLLVNLTGQAEDETLPGGSSEYHLGLEHFVLLSENIEIDMALLEEKDVKILMPITTLANGTKISYFEAPDHVRIELVQPVS